MDAPRLKVVVVGHVDHGKSTLVGRILFDTDSLPDGKVEQLRRASEAEGMAFEYAFLLDALLEEQEQNITIDTTQITFKTEKRGYTFIDAPGHKEFLKNMVTGAANADVALLLIAASEGVREQSRRHAFLLSLLGIRQIVVVVNKMDLVGYDQSTFQAIETEYRQFLQQIGLTPRLFIPVCAREGENIARKATETMPWYHGATILEALDDFAAPETPESLPLRLPVQDVYRFDDRRIIAGRIETGTLRVGERLQFSPGNRTSVVATLEQWNKPGINEVHAGDSVAFTLTEQIFVQRGQVASHDNTPSATRRFRARLFWMGREPLKLSDRLQLRLGTQESDAEVVEVTRVVDAGSLAAMNRDEIRPGDVADVLLQSRSALALDLHEQNPALGRFVLIAARRVSGGGIVLEALPDGERAATTTNLTWHDSAVTREERFRRNQHRGAVIWMTGLSGSGKSTLANAAAHSLFHQGLQTYVLDGDNLRHGLNSDLGFSMEDREENIRRAAEVALLLAESGQIVFATFISPLRESRIRARAIVEKNELPFVEVYVETSLAVCEERDPKGLYRRARAGEITNFTGIDSPYEPPLTPEIVLATEGQGIADAAERLVQRVKEYV